MKKEALIPGLITLASSVTAHGSGGEGHHVEQGIQIDPVLLGSVAMTLLGVLMLTFSFRKYRTESSS